MEAVKTIHLETIDKKKQQRRTLFALSFGYFMDMGWVRVRLCQCSSQPYRHYGGFRIAILVLSTLSGIYSNHYPLQFGGI